MNIEQQRAYLKALNIPVWRLRNAESSVIESENIESDSLNLNQEANEKQTLDSRKALINSSTKVTSTLKIKPIDLLVLVANQIADQSLQVSANELLQKMLAAIELNKEQCRIIYFSNLAVTKQGLNEYNLDIFPLAQLNKSALFSSSEDDFANLLRKYQPRALLLMGELSVKMLLNMPFDKLRTQAISQPFMQKKLMVFTTYQAADLIKNSMLKKSAWQDLKICKAYFDQKRMK